MKMVCALVAAWVIAPGMPSMASETAPLGSPDFSPSPERPVGWRGDGSGRFPGATPPTVWDRRVVGITSELMVQAVKPKGKPGADSHGLAYCTVKDWLVAGPFPVADPEKDLDTDFLGGEAEVQPDAGAKAGNTQWKVQRAWEGSQSYHNGNNLTCGHMWVDFVTAFGTVIPPDKRIPRGPSYTISDTQAAYAHTYIHAPRQTDVDVDIVHELPAVKMWVNGAPQRVAKTAFNNYGRHTCTAVKVHLNEGWNRLLVKAICGNAQKPNWMKTSWTTQWRFAAYVTPAGSKLNDGNARLTGSFSYETKNIAWMTKLTGRNASQPIVVGDKVFVGSGQTDLLCLDKSSGKVLWLHTGTYWDAMTAEERAAVKDKAGPRRADLEKANAELVLLLNANVTPQGLDTSRQAAIDKKLGERWKLAAALHDALATGNKGKLYLNEMSAGNATPTSDGRRVYWVVQGKGGFLTSAFDLNGTLIWSRFEYLTGIGGHGAHFSPRLCEGKLIVMACEQMLAYDAESGKELWRTPDPGRGEAIRQHDSESPIVVQFNGRPALQTTMHLVSLDGAVLAEGGYNGWGCYTAVAEGGVLYNSCNLRNKSAFEAIEIPTQAGAKPKVVWKLDAKALYGPLGEDPFYIASPLYVDGLVYQVDMAGSLAVVDTRDKKTAYHRWMDGYNFNHRFLYGYCASPTLGGKNIYLLDGAGFMTILRPGADGTVVGNNILENITQLPNSAPCRQEPFYGGMYLDGKRLFLHGDEYLYCIEEK